MKWLREALASRTLAVLTVTVVLALLAAPLTAQAQSAGKVWRIGVLWPVAERGAGEIASR